MKRINKNRQLNKLMENRIILIFCSLIFAIAFCTVILGTIYTQAAPAETTFKYYTSIQIQAGDTLWDIAKQYITDDYTDMNEYMSEVCSINHITKDNIHAGKYIVIPYYATEAIR